MGNDLSDPLPEHKSDSTPFWMFYTSDWAAGTIGFTLEQRGFYLECLRCMWERKGGLIDDAKWIASAVRCDPRTARRMRSFLINHGKLIPVEGLLINPRAARDIRKWRDRSKAKLGRSCAEDQPKLDLKCPEKVNESKGGGRTSDRQRQIQKDRSAFAPLVIEGGKTYTAPRIHDISDQALDHVRRIAPGWDRQMLKKKFLDWPDSRQADDLDRAFIGWVKSFTKGKKAS